MTRKKLYKCLVLYQLVLTSFTSRNLPAACIQLYFSVDNAVFIQRFQYSSGKTCFSISNSLLFSFCFTLGSVITIKPVYIVLLTLGLHAF